MERRLLLRKLASRLNEIDVGHVPRIAFDGVDCSGKTTMADEIAGELAAIGRPVIRAGIDSFKRPRSERYRRGADDPRGYFEDSFDVEKLRSGLLKPLEDPTCQGVRTAVFDQHSDSEVPGWSAIAPGSVLLFDGVFLQLPSLIDCWDFVVFLQVDFETVLRRAAARDRWMGTEEFVRAKYTQRYIPGQRLYLKSCEPESRADVLIRSDNPDEPELLRG